jgi:Niemann-Pick C1 protein
VTLFFIGYGAHNLVLGLDQATAVPTDSYLQPYFADLTTTLRVGPPVYFVVRPSEKTDFSVPPHQNLICGVSHCDEDSLETTLVQQASNPNGYIAAGANSWLDDYIMWLMSRGRCCRYNKETGAYCDSNMDDPNCVVSDICLFLLTININ